MSYVRLLEIRQGNHQHFKIKFWMNTEKGDNYPIQGQHDTAKKILHIRSTIMIIIGNKKEK